MERGVRKLGFKAVIVNSHIQGHYLDEPQFLPVLEAAEALGVPIYLHPNTPSPQMIQPFVAERARWRGLGSVSRPACTCCASSSPARSIASRSCSHHRARGEELPFWLYRLDYMHGATVRSKRYPFMKELKHPVSHYLKHNVCITNSGVAWQPAIEFCQKNIGVDRVLYAMDYPYQFVPEEVAICDAMSIPDADKRAFFEGNARRVFQLD